MALVGGTALLIPPHLRVVEYGLFFYKQYVLVTCLRYDDQYVHYKVQWLESQSSCLVTFIYAVNMPEQRTTL